MRPDPAATPEQLYVGLITHLQQGLEAINGLKAAGPTYGDGRALAVAATQLETAMLWVANANPATA